MTCSVHQDVAAAGPARISVNGVAIPRDAIAREAQHHPAGKPIAAWMAAARALVVRELLLQEARASGLVPVPLSDADGRRETDEEAMMRGLIERDVATPQPDDETCRRYYQQNLRRFRSADIFEAAHILFGAARTERAAYAGAREQAGSVLAALKANPERFAEFAAAHSICPSAAHGGNLGQITAGDTTPEFEQALRATAPGTLCPDPVETRYGVHIVRLDRRHEGRELPYQAVAGRIAEYLQENVRRRAVAQYIARLVSRADIRGIEVAGADALRVH
jgi:peptidyl-prolyl cis-trans isomerase C